MNYADQNDHSLSEKVIGVHSTLSIRGMLGLLQRQIGPDLEGNGTGVSAISESKAHVFGGFREQVAIFLERLVKTQRAARGFRPELAAPERN